MNKSFKVNGQTLKSYKSTNPDFEHSPRTHLPSEYKLLHQQQCFKICEYAYEYISILMKMNTAKYAKL